MTEKCFDEGTIQAFLDGELETDLLEKVARHTATCEVCSFMLQDAEQESAFAFSALNDEFNSLVPTERIRTNLYEAIAQIEKPKPSLWNRIFGFGLSFTNPSVLAFASLLLVFGLFTTLYIHRESQKSQENSIVQQTSKKVSDTPNKTESVINQSVATNNGQDNTDFPVNPSNEITPRRVVAKPPVEAQPTLQKANYREVVSPKNLDNRREPVNGTRNDALPGEESYVKTIATLSDTVNSHKDILLRPSERVAFEKDLAVVNDAITKMQKEVKRNPKNEAAKQVLRSSYQNKIDLLNSVAEKTELMALR
jgi:hypothetical protein